MRKRRGGVVEVASLATPEGFTLHGTGVSQSLFTAFLRCPMAFLYAINRWVKDKGGRTTGFGSITHEMLDKIYSQFMRRGKLPGKRRLDKWLDDYVESHREEFRGKSEEELEKDKAVICVLLTEYMEYHTDDWSKREWVSLEELFDIDWHGYRLRGKKDGRFRTNGKLWLLETKTMGRIQEEALLERLDLNFQNLFYITADEAQYNDPVRGVLYNVIRNPGHKQTKGESLRDLQAKVRDHVRRDPDHFFKRFEVVYTAKDKKVFQENLRYWLNRAQNCITGAEPWARNYTACDHKYTCDFISACSSGKMAGYTQRPSLFPELGAPA